MYYGTYPRQKIARLESLAKRYDLIASGGSDYHGLDNTIGAVDIEFLTHPAIMITAGLLYAVAGPMIRSLFPSAARAARTCLKVATEVGLETSTGGYWRSMKLRERPLKQPDPELAATSLAATTTHHPLLQQVKLCLTHGRLQA